MFSQPQIIKNISTGTVQITTVHYKRTVTKIVRQLHDRE